MAMCLLQLRMDASPLIAQVFLLISGVGIGREEELKIDITNVAKSVEKHGTF